MLISAVRYTRGLDLEARVYAETTGIAMGWLADNVFRCGCWVCEFVIERKLSGTMAQTERAVHKAFFELVEKSECLHWPKYLRYKDAPNEHEEVALARQTLKRSDEKNAKTRAGKASLFIAVEEAPPWELEPEAEKLVDRGAELPEDIVRRPGCACDILLAQCGLCAAIDGPEKL